MKGYVFPKDGDLDQLAGDEDELGDVRPWEAVVVKAVGAVIEFWGFKRNQGRVWALLYLRDQPMSAAEVRQALDLSKGAVSMILRELESWGVIQRTRQPESSSWHFVAEIELLEMIGRVFRDREVRVVRRVKDDLARAERLALQDDQVPEAMLDRLARMRRLAGLIEHALDVFLSTAQLDVTDVRGIFTDEDLAPPKEDPSQG